MAEKSHLASNEGRAANGREGGVCLYTQKNSSKQNQALSQPSCSHEWLKKVIWRATRAERPTAAKSLLSDFHHFICIERSLHQFINLIRKVELMLTDDVRTRLGYRMLGNKNRTAVLIGQNRSIIGTDLQ